MSYYISPRFLDKVAVHITKNFIDLPSVRVPLILGIHGRKGEGKSFQCELAFEQLGIEPVRMSAGELESPDAGDPVRLIRMRYREAAELIKVRGQMCALLINDLDAGAGRVDKTTQYTVNTQLVNGTLMNIADNPTDVQLPGSYETMPIHRVPIIVTGNDFSTLYAPLVRDGRMEKFYWEPSRADRIGIVAGIFEMDRLPRIDIETLVDYFSSQSIDFFGALRSQLYDEEVRDFIREIGLNRISTYLVNNPNHDVQLTPRNINLEHLIELGNAMVQEQKRLHETKLAKAYTSGADQQNGESHSSGGGRDRTFADESTHAVNPTSPSMHTNAASHEAPTYLDANGTENSHGNGAINTPEGWPQHVSAPKIEQLLQQAILQRGKLMLEVASPREKSANVWRTWSWSHPPVNATKAMAGIRDCVQENPKSFVKLIGYNPQTQTRLLEELIVRP
ncbi:MAG: AAA family ATPase [Cyanothece sp. SIO1E1]|nr:AAA family ATPase [Cyanothece sp. SIO1E1]